jgi:hypothetical protein
LFFSLVLLFAGFHGVSAETTGQPGTNSAATESGPASADTNTVRNEISEWWNTAKIQFKNPQIIYINYTPRSDPRSGHWREMLHKIYKIIFLHGPSHLAVLLNETGDLNGLLLPSASHFPF